jgi:antitoxin component YwqK of YwqJK toxin-antitoxin module|tara:strand:+ start:4534 stop:5052 length:519 start_codon:yes stop_codon:yes gene_type:complete
MKFIILITTFLTYLISFSINGQNHNQSEPIEKEGILYQEYPDTLFNGEHSIHYPNGSIKEILVYKNGKKEGMRETFHENGELFEKETYRNGNLEEIFEGFYDNGSLWWQGMAKNNLRDGFIKVFFENGQLKYIGQYENNSQEGLWDYYDNEGNPEITKCFLKNVEVDLTICK